MRAHASFLCLTLAALASSAVLAQPKDKGEGYAQAGRAAAAGRNLFPTADVGRPVLIATVPPTPGCFAWDELLTWSAKGGEALCVYTMTTTITLGGVNGAAAFTVVDANGPDGGGAGFLVPNGGSRDKLPGYLETYRAPGARSGICSAPVLGPGNRIVYPPCRVDGDCTDAGSSGTCDTATAIAARLQRISLKGCAFVVCQVDTNGTVVTWEEDK